MRTRAAIAGYRGSWAIPMSLVLQACASGIGSGPATPAARGRGIDTVGQAVVAAERSQQGATASGTLGVLPFRVSSGNAGMSALGYALADLLVTDLSRAPSLRLVERARLGDVLRELDLVSSGRIDSASAPRLGVLVRADRLVLGTLDTIGPDELRLAVRVADVSSGQVTVAIDARASAADILAAEKAIAFRVFDALGVTLTPAQRVQVETRATGSLDALLAYGRGVEAELRGDPRRAADEFRRAHTIDPVFEQAGARSTTVRAQAEANRTPVLAPGVRVLDASVSGAVDRLNRPLDLITSLSRPAGGVGDPSFPGTTVTVVITIQRP